MNLSRLLQTVALSLALTGAAVAAVPVARPVARPTAAVERVNINVADAGTLDRVLTNIGPAKAQAIVAYRKTNGPFRSIDQLALVKGIGVKTIEKNRDRIVLGNVAAARPVAARMPARGASLAR
ncbi:ComEA family DNA-binding protein [Cognatilysobacter lacus]|uniref:ComEA family DNA-binding protein n=1 Tax=Cognatilysobacter lacus TaxID=1643323 RepID=A0A5D8Z9U8_9GAMM|nr:ComEA family DNA-binding protein [Lysobacter lacus]TZF91581.1 ComEA family DNA-binding protein [Lysobacter lacus]